jgi:PAS domain S-box-containing protein
MFWKEVSLHESASFDAIQSIFAPEPAAQEMPGITTNEPNRRQESSRRLTWATHLVIAIVGLLTLLTAVVSVFDFQAMQFRPLSWQGGGEQLPAVVVVLLVIELALFVAVAVQDRLRRRVELLLQASEERIALAAESADLGLWRWDAREDRFWATPFCRAMFGIPDGTNFTMAAMSDAVHPDDRESVSEAIRRGFRENKVFEAEYRIALGDGKTRWVRTRGRPRSGPDGSIAHIAGTVADITAQMELKAEVERQQQSLAHLSRVGAVGELSSALAHELNQPLTAILSNAQAVLRILGKTPLDIQELKSAIIDIITDEERAGDVIRHLRMLLKKEDARPELLDVNEAVRKVLSLMRSDLTARRITVIARLSESRLQIHGDAVQIQQLLINLILNAADAMSQTPEHGGVLIVVTDLVGGEFAHIAVCDSGPGIRGELLDRLFEPFFTTKASGLGLGLSISRAIVTGHGGTIWAENNLGHGSTFHISIPRARREAA